jgi:hypothetical protein
MKSNFTFLKSAIFVPNMKFLEKNYYYFQTIFFVMGIIGWVLNFDKVIPITYAILCYIASIGMMGINILKLKWIREKKMKWGLNVGIPQLTFYGLLVFLIYFRFFGTVHSGIPVRLFAIVLTMSLLLDTFTKEVKYQDYEN